MLRLATKHKDQQVSGFTIVELLIVIIVIGILATLILVGYNNIQRQAATTVLQGDLNSTRKALDAYVVQNGSYPADLSSGFPVASTTKLEYTNRGSSYCITTSSMAAQTNFYFDSTIQSVLQGKCAGQVGYSSGIPTTSLVAGSGTTGYLDGPVASAQFGGAFGIALDSSGNLLVGDTGNYRIRKISNGTVSTFAGQAGPGGSVDGTGTSAKFQSPYAFAMDPSGNLWVADASGCNIKRVTPAAVVTTIAGVWGTCNATDGTGTAARFNFPSGIVIDPSNTFFYILDASNNEIRKMTMGGVVTTFVGQVTPGSVDGTGTAAKFNNPSSLAIDSAGNLWVTDFSNNEIRKVTPAGVVTTVAGSTTRGSADGTGSAASFYYPAGIAVDPTSGNIYINDEYNHRIRKMTPAGVVTTFMGSTQGYVEGTAAVAKFTYPTGMLIDSSGNMYIDDNGNRIRKINLN